MPPEPQERTVYLVHEESDVDICKGQWLYTPSPGTCVRVNGLKWMVTRVIDGDRDREYVVFVKEG